MPANSITSFGFLSSVEIDNLTPWQTTTSASQVVTFQDHEGNQLEVNALTLYASGSPLYVRINSGDYCVYVPANEHISVNGQVIENITFMGGSPITYRYHAQYK
jgi:UDP-N-acetylmuramyl pentapeptide synthase